MRFRIGPHTYSLRITEGPIVVDGASCLGASLTGSHEILIAADCPPKLRLSTLLYELTRAWSLETGVPRDCEGWYELAATMAVAAMVDLNNQGGEMALLSLRDGESPQPAAAKIGLTRNRCCGICGGTVAGGSVECVVAGPGVCELRLYCEHCGMTMVWREAQTARGLPSGQVLGEPKARARRQARGGDGAGIIGGWHPIALYAPNRDAAR
jgi:hypothetical protein